MIYKKWGPAGKERGKGGRGGWGQNMGLFRRWCDGTTGVPLIDADMRELTLTGFMSNR